MEGMFEVSEAAQQLSISGRRVRSLIESGALPAERVGAHWLVPAHAIADFAPRSDGRPMAPSVAWACLALLAGKSPDELSPSHVVRLKRRMKEQLSGAPDAVAFRLRSWCSARAVVRRSWVFGPALEDLSDDRRLILAGPSADSNFSDRNSLDAYVSGRDLAAIEGDHGLSLQRNIGGRKPNLILRVAGRPDVIPRDENSARRVALAVVGVDLMDSGDPRAVDEGQRLISNAVRQWREMSDAR
jgi:excisionase family DNA binding protein